MNICLVIPTFDLLGGAETHVNELARDLSGDESVRVSVLCARFAGISERETRNAHVIRLPVRGFMVDWLSGNLGYGVTDDAPSLRKYPSRLCRFAFSLRFFLASIDALKTSKPDIVDAHSAPFTVAFLANLLRVPYVITIHTTDAATRMKGPFGFAYRYLMANAVSCVAIGLRIARNLEAAGVNPNWVKIVPTAISMPLRSDYREIQRRRIELMPNSDIILYFGGRFVASKGIDILINAVAQLRNCGERVGLICAGTGPELPDLRQLTQRLGIDNYVRFIGALESRDLRACVEACDIGVFPSRGGEGLPRALLETMALGKPVIVSRQGDMPYVARDCGVILETTSCSELSEAILSIARSPSKREMGEKARIRIESEFTTERVMRDLLPIYRRRFAGDHA